MAEITHGSSTGVAWHNKKHEPFCVPCADYAADRGRAYAIRSTKRKTVQISTRGLARILCGDNPAEVLAGELGPHTFEALRTLGGGQRG